MQVVNIFDRDIKDSERELLMPLMDSKDPNDALLLTAGLIWIQRTINKEIDESRALQFMQKSGVFTGKDSREDG